MRAILMRAIPRMVARLLVAAFPWIAIASLPLAVPAHLTGQKRARSLSSIRFRAKRKDFNQ